MNSNVESSIVRPHTHRRACWYSHRHPLALAIALSLLPSLASAVCVETELNTVTCDNTGTNPTTTIGAGWNQPTGSVLNVLDGVVIDTGNRVAISYNDGATINIGDNAIIRNNARTNSGPLGLGANAIEFSSNTLLNIGVGAQVLALGTVSTSEAINVHGGGNTIINRGFIYGAPAKAIYFEGLTAGANTVDNYGVIGRAGNPTLSVISGGNARAPIIFINRSGARVEGSLIFGRGNDVLTLEAGSLVTGNFDGGGGTNTLNLSGDAGTSDSLSGTISNFSLLNKTGAGQWTLSGALGNSSGGNLAVSVYGGTLILTGDNSDFRGSITNASGGTLEARAQSLPLSITNDGLVRFAQSDDGTYAGIISGNGSVEKTGAGVLSLSGINTFSGGTTVKGGTLSAATDNALGVGTGALTLDGGTFNFANSFALGNDRLVSITQNDGGLSVNGGATGTINQIIDGAGQLSKSGAGVLVLGGNNRFRGATHVLAGSLEINGDQSAATGDTDVASGATLAGTGTLGGSVTISDGATLAPGALGAAPGVLSINRDLNLSAGSILAYRLGQAGVAGGALNDLTDVHGDLVLDGVLNATVSPGGSYAPGLYRLINYTGTLTNNGLALGVMPTAVNYVQTSVAGQVNLVNNADLTLRFWDGEAGGKNDGAIFGGDGLWQAATGNDVWTEYDGSVNGAFGDRSFAVFTGVAGTVTVDPSLGGINASGMQFAQDGYRVQGGAITLVGSVADPAHTVIRVGDGTAPGFYYTATIDSELTGASGLTKTDAGTLVLNALNTYNGGTWLEAGTIRVSRDENLGSLVGALVFDGGALSTSANLSSNRAVTFDSGGATLTPDADTTLTLTADIDGVGGLSLNGEGSTVLNGRSTYAGATDIQTGTLVVGDASHTNAALMGAGPTTVADGATLGGYGTVTGSVSNHGTLAVANALAGFAAAALGTFTINGVLDNAGTVVLGGTGVGNTLTVASYAGENGTVHMNTVLGAEGSASDRLLIDGGQASGASRLLVNNVGGLGALTPGDGIKLVGTLNGGTTTEHAFTLGNRVVGGPYEYSLHRGGRDGSASNDWFLRSQKPNQASEPEYRREISDYSALSAMMLDYGRQTIGSLHLRVGDEEGGAGRQGSAHDRVWARSIGQNGQWQAKSGGIYRDGPSFDINVRAAQGGVDLLRTEQADGSSDRAGVYGALGQGSGNVKNYDGTSAGSNSFDALSVGAYWTHYNASGAYVDAVVQGSTYYDVKSGSQDLGKLKTDALALAASVEAGMPFKLAGRWSIEPQAQLVYQGVKVDDSRDSAAKVHFAQANALTARVGARLSKDWQTPSGRSVSTWIRPSVWHEFSANPATSVSSAAGNVPFHSDQRGTWSEVAAGFDAPVSKNASVYGTLEHQQGIDTGLKTFGASLGVRISW